MKPTISNDNNAHLIRPLPEPLLIKITDYIFNTKIVSPLAFKTAYIALLDSLGCALMAHKKEECWALLGPYIPGTLVPKGSRVPGTHFQLDPIKAAFDIGCSIRWLDYNDTWLAKEWGHPSDNLGGILAVADYVAESNSIKLIDILELMIKAYEIQGMLSISNALNRFGFDHVFFVKLATAAAVAPLLGLSQEKTLNLLSQVFADGATLRSYRHAPNTMARKSWAAGDATRRGVELAWIVKNGQKGLPLSLSAKKWGFNEVVLKGNPLILEHPLKSFVMENILFKVKFPAEFHAQTAVEAAILLHQDVKDKIELIEKIEINTQEPAIRIIHKEGPLYNEADRDHCLQYMVAIGLLFGELVPHHYTEEIAKDTRIDELRNKMVVTENKGYSQDYLDINIRSIANSVQVFFKDGKKTKKVEIHFPLGHPRRRLEAEVLLKNKYFNALQQNNALRQSHSQNKKEILINLWDDYEEAKNYPLQDFISFWVIP